MFKVEEQSTRHWMLRNELHYHLHSDGSIYHGCGEYWPTRRLAQAVLDKYQPAHVWKHGDVFRRKSGAVFIYLVIHEVGPIVYILDYSGPGKGVVDICLTGATFLFNIKEKL